MKSLFNEKTHRYTETTCMVEDLSREAIRETFKVWTNAGYSAREISYILLNLVRDIELYTILDPTYPPKEPK